MSPMWVSMTQRLRWQLELPLHITHKQDRSLGYLKNQVKFCTRQKLKSTSERSEERKERLVLKILLAYQSKRLPTKVRISRQSRRNFKSLLLKNRRGKSIQYLKNDHLILNKNISLIRQNRMGSINKITNCHRI